MQSPRDKMPECPAAHPDAKSKLGLVTKPRARMQLINHRSKLSVVRKDASSCKALGQLDVLNADVSECLLRELPQANQDS